ncbi:hypothetical protein EVAR_66518_1 [Eumeta japonica]|uniref:Uncharacterized protein n=1 Tax=Eumeta variegata TaxID=151549 RepID=A0A4C1Z7U4_EUMVA|nr:hypothetical protein EVAR_66518_1 [Eumeta japonica]
MVKSVVFEMEGISNFIRPYYFKLKYLELKRFTSIQYGLCAVNDRRQRRDDNVRDQRLKVLADPHSVSYKMTHFKNWPINPPTIGIEPCIKFWSETDALNRRTFTASSAQIEPIETASVQF